MKDNQIKNDLSCGVIALRYAAEWEVLLIDQINFKNTSSYWTFPKGHQEVGETYLQTAKREFLEETGIVPKNILTSKTFNLKYSFLAENLQINKTVKFFLGIVGVYDSQSITPQVEEVKDLGWFSFSDSQNKLSHSNTKYLLKKVEAFTKTEEFKKFAKSVCVNI